MRKYYNSKQKENHKKSKDIFARKNANSTPRIQKRRYMSKIIDLFAYLSIILLII